VVAQNPAPPDWGVVVGGAVVGDDGAVAGTDGAAVTSVPEGLSAHQTPKESLTPWPLAVPDPLSPTNV
jgi:hypothetical protein